MYLCCTSADEPFVPLVIDVLVCPASTLLVSIASSQSFMFLEQVSCSREYRLRFPSLPRLYFKGASVKQAYTVRQAALQSFQYFLSQHAHLLTSA